MRFLISAAITTIIIMTSCGQQIQEHKVASCIDSFAIYYFNYDFTNARRFVTDDSEKWLQFAASNVHESDIEILKKQDMAKIEITDIEISDNLTDAEAKIDVKGWLHKTIIGKDPIVEEKTTIKLFAVKDGEQWKVKMVNLPQSEKRNHD